MFIKDWFNPKMNIDFKIIDIAEEEWIADYLANFVYKQIKDKALHFSLY